MDNPKDLYYAKTHEWSKKEDGNKIRVGITSHAQSQLGDVVYVELPALDRIVREHEACVVIESVKAAYDIYAPVSGKVVEINNDLESSPQLINEDPFGKGWLYVLEMEDPEQLNNLLSNKEYEDQCRPE